jgi:hypothetical protein
MKFLFYKFPTEISTGSVMVKISSVVWDLMLYSPLKVSQRFRGMPPSSG